MNKPSEQEIREIFDAVEAWRQAHPEQARAIEQYEQMRREQQKAWYREHPCSFSISETTSLDAPPIFTYPAQMLAHPLLHRATAWIMALYRYAKEQGWEWTAPDVPVTNDDKVMLAWQHEKKILNILIWQERISAITISPEDRVENSDAGSGRALYAWLISSENGTD